MLFDSNVWLALTFSAHPHHALAKEIFTEATAEHPACFCRATQQSFLRLSTAPALLKVYGAEGFGNEDAAKLQGHLVLRFLQKVHPQKGEKRSQRWVAARRPETQHLGIHGHGVFKWWQGTGQLGVFCALFAAFCGWPKSHGQSLMAKMRWPWAKLLESFFRLSTVLSFEKSSLKPRLLTAG